MRRRATASRQRRRSAALQHSHRLAADNARAGDGGRQVLSFWDRLAGAAAGRRQNMQHCLCLTSGETTWPERLIVPTRSRRCGLILYRRLTWRLQAVMAGGLSCLTLERRAFWRGVRADLLVAERRDVGINRLWRVAGFFAWRNGGLSGPALCRLRVVVTAGFLACWRYHLGMTKRNGAAVRRDIAAYRCIFRQNGTAGIHHLFSSYPSLWRSRHYSRCSPPSCELPLAFSGYGGRAWRRRAAFAVPLLSPGERRHGVALSKRQSGERLLSGGSSRLGRCRLGLPLGRGNLSAAAS